MTAAPRADAVERTVVVAVCQGHRCRALLTSQEPDGRTALRAAAAASDRGVLLSTACAGACAHGPVVAWGTGRSDDGALHVTTSALLGPLGPAHIHALAEHLQQPPDPRLPAPLAEVRLWPAGTR